MAEPFALAGEGVAERNAPYVKPGAAGFNAPLDSMDELEFRAWVARNKVPFNADAAQSDYDMRGFWSALQRGDSRAAAAINRKRPACVSGWTNFV